MRVAVRARRVGRRIGQRFTVHHLEAALAFFLIAACALWFAMWRNPEAFNWSPGIAIAVLAFFAAVMTLHPGLGTEQYRMVRSLLVALFGVLLVVEIGAITSQERRTAEIQKATIDKQLTAYNMMVYDAKLLYSTAMSAKSFKGGMQDLVEAESYRRYAESLQPAGLKREAVLLAADMDAMAASDMLGLPTDLEEVLGKDALPIFERETHRRFHILYKTRFEDVAGRLKNAILARGISIDDETERNLMWSETGKISNATHLFFAAQRLPDK
jgi:hypothetical protein